MLSIIIPELNEAENLDALFREISESTADIECEVHDRRCRR